MKKTLLFSLLIVASFSFATVKAQTANEADDIINKYVEAIGGVENWKKVNSVVQTGTMMVQGLNLELVVSTLHNKGMRQDIIAMGMTNYMILTPTEGWRYFPIQGQQAAEALTEDDVKDGQDGLDVQGSLVDYKAKGHTVELLGKEDVDGTECFKIKLNLKSGKTETYYIDPKTYLVVKSTRVMKANGQEAEMSTGYSNYQKLTEGITVPMSLSIPLGPGMNADFSISKFEVNKAIDEAIFKPSN